MARSSAMRFQMGVLALVWLVGAGLWFAPPEAAPHVRGFVRDVLIPGQSGVQTVSDGVAASWRDWCLQKSRIERREFETLEREAALWRQRALSLQVRSAQLRRQLDAAGDADHPFPVMSSEPLVVNRLVSAQLLGSTRAGLERRLRPIINCGDRHGIDVEDLVLADGEPHLDQGSEAGLVSDNLVLDGVQVVGRIREVGRWTSTVQLLTDEEYRGIAQLVRQGTGGPVFGAEGILAGNGDGTCRLELVDVAAPVAVGDTVFLPADRAGLPGSVYYGRVVEATVPEAAPYWSIRVAPYLDDDYSEHLQVLLATPNPRRLVDNSVSNHSSRMP